MVAISKGPAFNNEHENVRSFKRDYFEEEHLCYTVKVIQYDFMDTANLLIFIEVILYPELYKFTGIKRQKIMHQTKILNRKGNSVHDLETLTKVTAHPLTTGSL